MKALELTTRYRDGAFEGDACLLVYDVISFSGATLGDDVRDVLDRRPNTAQIFILAPFLPSNDVDAGIVEGSALHRAGANLGNGVVKVSNIRLSKNNEQLVVESQSFSLNNDGIGDPVLKGDWRILADELRHGWLFCLFNMHGGLVNAPAGVHFSKASGKHADKFLRTSSVLLTSEACGVLAFFVFPMLRVQQPRRIFVDTAHLIAVALAMHRIAINHNVWAQSPPVKSFSSYGGLEKIPRLGRSDLMLISASTSGGLAQLIVDKGVAEDMLATLYFLSSSLKSKTKGQIVCDLTYLPSRTFGYPSVVSYSPGACELCAKKYVVADLEGDQFLIERRGVKRLRIGSASQIGSARETMEHLARKELIAVRLHKEDSRRTDIEIDVCSLLRKNGHLNAPFRRLLSRFTPTPIHFVVLIGLKIEDVRASCESTGFYQNLANAQFVDASQIEALESKAGSNALVVVDYLCDHALLRGVNAQLRSKVGGGSVAYLSGLTMADSPRNFADLRIFLQYGEHGAETFIFRSAAEVMLPWTGEQVSPWLQELQLLRVLKSESTLAENLNQRLDWLSNTASAKNQLFLSGLTNELTISPDFVLLDTKENREFISQADVYAVVCNCLAAERSDRQPLDAKVLRSNPTPVWGQSIYVQSLLCPSNFRDFNDAVLRAALLRGATEQELNYSVDEVCADEMYEVIRADILAWHQGKGDALPEFFMSMACGRLRLQKSHVERIKQLVESTSLPNYLKLLGNKIPRN